MTPVWFVSLLRLAWQIHSQKGCIPPALLYRCNDIPSTHNMGQVIGRIELKPQQRTWAYWLERQWPTSHPLHDSPLYHYFRPYFFRLSIVLTTTSSLNSLHLLPPWNINRTGQVYGHSRQYRTVHTHTHTHTHTSMELRFKEGETTGRVIYVLRSTCLLPCGEEVKLLPAV